MELEIYQVDVFTGSHCQGSPAAVCPLAEWLPDETMQNIATRINVSNTAFFVPAGHGYDLRWFTPQVEVALCGHATLASALILMTERADPPDTVVFHTKSGDLTVTRQADRYTLDFPALQPERADISADWLSGLGGKFREIWRTRDYLVVYDTEDEVKALQPDMSMLSQHDRFATIVTAPGNEVDYVLRFFAPQQGIPEDPATGSAHCTLAPYWAQRLGRNPLHARQVSGRGGEFWCELSGDRVRITGEAVLSQSYRL